MGTWQPTWRAVVAVVDMDSYEILEAASWLVSCCVLAGATGPLNPEGIDLLPP